MSAVQYYMRSYCAKHMTVCARRGEPRERKREREREPAEGATPHTPGKGERSGWDGGRFLPARSEILAVFCVSKNLISCKCRPKSFLHASRSCYIAQVITLILFKTHSSHRSGFRVSRSVCWPYVFRTTSRTCINVHTSCACHIDKLNNYHDNNTQILVVNTFDKVAPWQS